MLISVNIQSNLDRSHLILQLTVIMKEKNQQKKGYLLLTDLVKQAKLRQSDKQNLNINANKLNNDKILLSKYLEGVSSLKNTYKVRNGQQQSNQPQISFKSDQIFDEDDFVHNQLHQAKKTCQLLKEEPKIEQLRKSVQLRNNKRNYSLHTEINNKQNGKKGHQKKQSLCKFSKVNDKQPQPITKSIQVKQNQIKNVLKQIQENKRNQTLKLNQTKCSLNQTHKHDNSKLYRTLDSQNREQIEPIMNLVEQMISSDNILFDPEKFNIFLKNIKQNSNFQKSLRAFIYSYFLQNELKH